MDHRLETHVHLAAADDLRHVGGVIRFQDGDLDSLIFEVALGVRQVERDVVWGCVPGEFEELKVMGQQKTSTASFNRTAGSKGHTSWSRT